VEWCQRIPTPRGDPLDYARFPFQRELYQVFGDPDVKDAVAMKGVQLGMSELCVRLTLYFADVFGLTSLYVFPALKQMNDFSDTRVNRMIENSSYLRDRTQSNPLNKGLKRVGNGYCHYRGSESNRDLLAIDADVVALDEYDSLVPENIPDAERRVSASPLGLIRRIGVPTDPEFGIGKLYAQSDRRQWHARCDSCTEWQPLTFHQNVSWDQDGDVIQNARLVCRRCRRRLDVSLGEWVAELPSRGRPGFHVHRLLVPNADLVPLVESSRERQPHLVRSFWNKDLGLPHTDKSGGLDRAALAAAVSAGKRLHGQPLEMTDSYNGTNFVTAGIDVASTRALNVRISEHLDPLTERGHRKRALWIGTVDSFDELPGLITRYDIGVLVIDHMPEWRLAQGLVETFPGCVYTCHYASQQHDALFIDTEDRKVGVQRTPAFDATVEVLRAQRNLLPEDMPRDYVSHMVTPRRVVESDEYDRQTAKWEERGASDYFHAEVYDLIATEVAKFRLNYMALAHEEITTLDEVLPFERSRVNDYDDMSYRPGPGGDGYPQIDPYLE
jgi:hypothetical protein